MNLFGPFGHYRRKHPRATPCRCAGSHSVEVLEMHRLLIAACIAVLLFIGVRPMAAQVTDLPAGWIRAGSRPADYEMAVDPAGGRTAAAAFIRARGPNPPDGFGTLMQTFQGTEYYGKRLRFSGYVRAANISNWAGLWMRVDGPPGRPALAFDNMHNRPIKGTSDWRRYEIVLDVPAATSSISFGILLSGPGQAWIDDLQFEVVGRDVPMTGLKTGPSSITDRPRSLGFDP
jgi:hypothetical protein